MSRSCRFMQYLVIDEELSGSVQTLQEHQFVWLFRNGVGQRSADADPRGPQPQTGGEGPQLWDRVFHQSEHVVCPCWEGQSVALWERMPCNTVCMFIWMRRKVRQKAKLVKSFTVIWQKEKKDQIDVLLSYFHPPHRKSRVLSYIKQSMNLTVFLMCFFFLSSIIYSLYGNLVAWFD